MDGWDEQFDFPTSKTTLVHHYQYGGGKIFSFCQENIFNTYLKKKLEKNISRNLRQAKQAALPIRGWQRWGESNEPNVDVVPSWILFLLALPIIVSLASLLPLSHPPQHVTHVSLRIAIPGFVLTQNMQITLLVHPSSLADLSQV